MYVRAEVDGVHFILQRHLHQTANDAHYGLTGLSRGEALGEGNGRQHTRHALRDLLSITPLGRPTHENER